jgi:hypothetical protein
VALRCAQGKVALGEGLGAAGALVFHGFGGGEFAVNMGFGAGASGMEHTALAGADATGGTGDRRKLGGGEVFHTQGKEHATLGMGMLSGLEQFWKEI